MVSPIDVLLHQWCLCCHKGCHQCTEYKLMCDMLIYMHISYDPIAQYISVKSILTSSLQQKH